MTSGKQPSSRSIPNTSVTSCTSPEWRPKAQAGSPTSISQLWPLTRWIFPTVPLLTDALVASGHPEKVGPAGLAAWEIHLDQSISQYYWPWCRTIAFYQEGKLEECRRLCEGNGSLRGSVYRLHSLLAVLGHAREAAADLAFEPLKADPWSDLSLSLGFALDGHKKEADQWHDRGCEKLEKLPEASRGGRVAAGRRATHD